MSAITETYLTLVGKRGSRPLKEREILDYPGEGHCVVDRVMTLADGSWKAYAVPSQLWRRFNKTP